ncbi:MAG: glycosidase, partial [Candidatus Hodarchaeota archaeon]
MKHDYVIRYKNNPILTVNDIPYAVETVHNAGVVKHNSKYIMLFRSHRKNGRSIIGIAESQDGFNFASREEPFMIPAGNGVFKEYEEFGVEDPRITFIEDAYYITYSAYSRHGVRIGLAKTQDFVSIERVAFITQADYRNTVLFPEKINGRYVKLDRPHSDISPWSIWISFSPDLRYWGDSRIVMKPVMYHWDEMKIGPGAPPIRTEDG